MRSGISRRSTGGQSLLDATRPQWSRAHVHQGDAVSLDRDTDYGPVDTALGELLERPATRLWLGEPDLRQQLPGLQCSLEQVAEEVRSSDFATPRRPAGNQGCPEPEDDGRQVRRWIGVCQRTADGAPVPHLRITDLTGRVGQQRQLASEQTRSGYLVVAGESADRD